MNLTRYVEIFALNTNVNKAIESKEIGLRLGEKVYIMTAKLSSTQGDKHKS